MQITVNIGVPKFLRRSYHAVDDRFGKAGLVVAIIALIVVLGGAAFAATGGLTGKQKKEVTAIAKKFAGTNGTNGSNGAAGAEGKQGPQGLPGTNGTNGTNGKSILIGTPTGTECHEGGVTVQAEGSGSKTAICNGREGLEGKSLSSHTFLGGAEPVGHPCHGNGGAEIEAESNPGVKEYVCNGEPGPVTEVAPAGLTMRGVINYQNFVQPYRLAGGSPVAGYLQPQAISTSFPFRVENSSGEGPAFHYIRSIEGGRESFELTSGLIVGPATGTGTVYGPAAAEGDFNSGSKEVTGLVMVSGAFAAGQAIEGEGIPPATTVTAVGSGTLELSNPATETKSPGALTGLASNKVDVDVTSGEFVVGIKQEPDVNFGPILEGEGIAAETMVTNVTSLPGAEVQLTLSKEPTETKAAEPITGNASKTLTVLAYVGSGGLPTVGETVSGPGIPAGATITRILSGNGYPNHPQFEISSLPTVSSTDATLTVGLPVGCKGTTQNPGAEPGNFCFFGGGGNILQEGAAIEEIGFPFYAAFEGLHHEGNLSPTDAEFFAASWFPLPRPGGGGVPLPEKLFEMSTEQIEALEAGGAFEGVVTVSGSWAVTAP